MKHIKASIVLAAVALMATPAFAQIINLAAADTTKADYSTTPVTMAFDAGTYDIKVVGKAGGGLYDGWGVATPAAGNYNDAYSFTAGGVVTSVDPYNGQRFATATDALDAFSGIVTSFTLAAAGNVSFVIPDTWYYDNIGGVSLKVSPSSGSPAPVPEPAMMGLFALGAAGLFARSRRKGKTAIA